MSGQYDVGALSRAVSPGAILALSGMVFIRELPLTATDGYMLGVASMMLVTAGLVHGLTTGRFEVVE